MNADELPSTTGCLYRSFALPFFRWYMFTFALMRGDGDDKPWGIDAGQVPDMAREAW
jgi:hypothetical protein